MAAATAVLTKSAAGKALVASSRAEFRSTVLKGLASAGTLGAEAAGGADALIKLESNEFCTLYLDPQIEDLDVEELVATIHFRYPELDVVVLAGEKVSEQFDFISLSNPSVSPEDPPCEENSGIEEDPQTLWSEPSESSAPVVEAAPTKMEPLSGMIGTSRKMQQLYRLAKLVAPRDTSVLIVGATGTGKELVARGIHELSRRSRGPFVVVNCAAIPESLLEAELFGFTRGAFTGAFQSRLGRIHAAHGGTLLLDEVGELPLSMQAKLLRFVQEGEVQRLGSADLFRVDARLIAATNADLLQRVREKQFREDLYYRLAVFPIELPPLCNRLEDIFPLAQHFLAELCRQSNVPRKTFSPEAAIRLRAHLWPGNVRELQHWIERAFVLAEAKEQIRAGDLGMQSDGA
jgi:transcriptional regulator with GAF, ATPase, and Fis domain